MRPLIGAAFLFLICQAAYAQEAWPRLEGETSARGCQQALAVARAAFQSGTFNVGDWQANTTPPGATVVLKSGPEGEIDDAAIVADSAVFTRMREEGQWERLDWARATGGLRLVIVSYAHSWRGDNYDAYAVPETMTPEEFRAAMHGTDTAPPSLSGFTDTSWRTPIVLRDDATGALTLISVVNGALEDWSVFSQSGTAFERRCVVHFRPEVDSGVRQAIALSDQLLPASVRSLAQDIDATLGQDGAGTLNPIGYIRVSLSQAWANVALRPWALNSSYLTPRPLVDAGLRRWSRRAPSFRVAYDALIERYPRAQRALAAYYQRTFRLSPPQAREMAAYALDFTLRLAYHFPGTSSETIAASSPWPADVPRGG